MAVQSYDFEKEKKNIRLRGWIMQHLRPCPHCLSAHGENEQRSIAETNIKINILSNKSRNVHSYSQHGECVFFLFIIWLLFLLYLILKKR